MLYKRNPQLNKNGELIHLLSTEGLSRDILTHILDTAANFVSVSDREVKKVPLLRGKSVFNLFLKTAPGLAPHLKLQPRVCRPT
jgi:aspartate carbamoyltransferase catalytic subunit